MLGTLTAQAHKIIAVLHEQTSVPASEEVTAHAMPAVEKHRVNPSANGHHYLNPSLLLISSVLSVIRKIPLVVRDNDFCYVFFFKQYLFTISNPRNKLRFNNRLVITRAVPQYDRSNLVTHASFWLGS
jgi:hypothetical protein